jgi:hypothetical protein
MTWGVGLFGTLALAACGGDDTAAPGGDTDAGSDSSVQSEGGTGNETGTSSEASTTSEGGEGGTAALVMRGDYLVNHVAACPDCHTPRTMTGAPDTTKFLAGSATPFADIQLDPMNPDATKGKIYVKNLTPDMTTGLGSWTDQQIKDAFLNGTDKDGKPLFYIMPYFVFHNMTSQDADAIVAYIRSIKAVANAIPADQPLPFPFPMPVPAFDAAKIPDTTLAKTDPNYAAAEKGRYLAGNVGICMECHTEHNMAPPILKETALFGGNNSFPSASLGLPPAYPMVIYSANITPDDSGIKGWVAADVAKVLATGVNKAGQPLCPPMPFGPMGAFGGLTDEDRTNIGLYITSLPPVANPGIQFCVDPFKSMPAEGGMSEGGSSDDGSTDAGGQ